MQIGLSLGLTTIGTRGGATDTPDLGNGAAILLHGESNGLAFDFTDQSALIIDQATSANMYNSTGLVSLGNLIGPAGKLTYTSPSVKICRQSSGYWQFGAHNLYLNSAAPANQSITTKTGCTYAVTITGTVSITASGAATGTWTAGTNTFTAATTTLTLGSTSGSGTVHVRETPSVDTYVATAGAIKVQLPYSYSAGDCEGILVEEARTNYVVYSRDLTQAATGSSSTLWMNQGATVAKTVTGVDGVANSACSVTASGASGGSVGQAQVLGGASTMTTSLFVKRPSTLAGSVMFSDGVTTTGSTIVTNGDFATTDLTGWTDISTGTGSVSAATGAAVFTQADASNRGVIEQALTVSPGRVYKVTATFTQISNGSIGVVVCTGANQTGTLLLSRSGVTGSTVSYHFVATSSTVYLVFTTGGPNANSFSIDDISCLLTTETDITADVTTEWTRYSKTNGSTLQHPAFSVRLTDQNDVIYVDMAQTEVGAFATSPIITGSASVTRAADSGLTMATSLYPHSATVGTAMVRYKPQSVSAAMVALRLDDGTANEVISVGHSAAAAIGLTVTDGGAAQTAPLTDGTATVNTFEKLAVSWKANDFLFSDNGATAVADTSGTLPTVTSIDIGPTLTGIISHVLVVPVEKSAAEVAEIATP